VRGRGGKKNRKKQRGLGAQPLPGRYLWGFFTPPVCGAALRAALVAKWGCTRALHAPSSKHPPHKTTNRTERNRELSCSFLVSSRLVSSQETNNKQNKTERGVGRSPTQLLAGRLAGCAEGLSARCLPGSDHRVFS
jgi:hypothetical protein